MLVTTCALADARIAESSGVGAVTADRTLVWTHDDSGDSARFFAVSLADCRTRAVYAVRGVTATDWEDVAVDHRRRVLWFGDVGDNDARRGEVQLVRVPEPAVPAAAAAAAPVVPVGGTVVRLRYPDGAHDCETVLVDPASGQVFLVTKSYAGTAVVYAAPLPLPASGVSVLERVGSVRVAPTIGGAGPRGVLTSAAVTGGAVSPDGRRVVLRTYAGALEWDVPATGALRLADALRGTPRVVALPRRPQGEGIAYTLDGRSLVTTTEGVGGAVDVVADPPPAATAASPTPVIRSPVARPAVPSRTDHGRWRWGAAVVLAGAVLAVVQRRRSRMGR